MSTEAPPPLATTRTAPAGKPATRDSSDRITIVHVEEQPHLRDVVRAAVDGLPHTRYVCSDEAARLRADGPCTLVINLVARTTDPLSVIAGATDCDPFVFAYCVDGRRGFVIGMVDCFPHPFDPERCAARLQGRTDTLQRLLAVSDDVDAIGRLRDVLARLRCSLSMAFDSRQAVDLIPMVHPDVVLVDCASHRRDGLALVGRLRFDPKTAVLPIGLTWTRPLSVADVQQQAARAAAAFPFNLDELQGAARRIFGSTNAGHAPEHVVWRSA